MKVDSSRSNLFGALALTAALLCLPVAGCGDDGNTPPGAGGSGGGAAGRGGSGGTAGTGGSAGTGGTAGTGGSAGSGGAPRTDAARPADTAARSDRGPVGDGGGTAADPAIDQLCTPQVEFDNQAATSAGGMRFNQFVPDPVATMQKHSRAVCRLLYRKPEEVRRNASFRLIIAAMGGVAFTGGGQIHFSSNYIGGIGGNAQAQEFEINGVLVHEVTHLWQSNQGGGGSLVEAMADWVRYRAGFDRLARRRPGGNWSDAYTTGGFFIAWIEDKYDKDFGYKVNIGMKNRNFSYPALVQQITGKDIDSVWADYQAELMKR